VRKRQEKKKRLQNSVEKIIKGITSRKTVWAIDKVMDMDALCLKHGKRCIMWDDEGNGFYLVRHKAWRHGKIAHTNTFVCYIIHSVVELGLERE
jgi:hypothetical protein